MTELRQIAVVADELDVVRILRARMDELNVSRKEVSIDAGLTESYAEKLLCLPPIKYFGPKSFWNLLESVGYCVIIAEDPLATARFAAKMDKRDTKNVRQRAFVRSGRIPWLITPEKGREMAKLALANMGADRIRRQRSKAGRASGKARRLAARARGSSV